jgi:NTP pyrophosphatase (non-canonical NTP hydrolase)
MQNIKEELADVLIYCLDMAVMLDLDLENLVKEKLEMAKVKYPAELFKNEKQDKHGESALLWKIKKEHRKNKS